MKYSADYFLLQQRDLNTEFMWRFSSELGHGYWNKYAVSVGAVLANGGTAESMLMQVIEDQYIKELAKAANETVDRENNQDVIESVMAGSRTVFTHDLDVKEYRLVPKEGDQS